MTWISIKDSLPDYDEPVLWYLENGNMCVEALDKDGTPWLLKSDAEQSDNDWGSGAVATHWTKLPEPPLVWSPHP